MSSSPGRPSPKRPVLAGLRSALPGNRKELLDAALLFGPSVGAAVLLEMTFDLVLPAIPTGLTLSVSLLLLSARWLRRHKTSPSFPLESRRLPPRIEALIGRDREVREVADLALKSRLVVVRGVTGIGTSAVAVNAGWRVAPEPEQQHYADLRGQDRDEPENWQSVAERVLRTLGRPLGPIKDERVAAQEVSTTLHLSGRLLLLDNVARWDQVAWLPRHVPGSRIIVAGDLVVAADDLNDVEVVHVGILDAADGLELLRSRIEAEQMGVERLRDEPEAGDRLAKRFLRRPALVVGIGRWLTQNRKESIASLVDQLEAGPRDRVLQVLLDLQLRRVSQEARQLLGLLVYAPIAELGTDGVAALAGSSEDEAGQAMEELSRYGLAEMTRRRIRVVGAARAIVTSPDGKPGDAKPERWKAALQRLVKHFADRADLLADRLPQEEARGWFGLEDRALLQMLKMPEPAPQAAESLWRIADALEVWFALEQRHEERREAACALAKAAKKLRYPDAWATAELRLCLIALELGEPGRAREHFDEAARLQAGVESWPAQLHLARAATLLAAGDEFAAVEAALVQYGQALPGGDTTGQATRLINMAVLQIRRGQVSGFTGRKDGTAPQHGDAVPHESVPGTQDEAHRLYRDAVETLVQALEIARRSGDLRAEAHTLELLALVNRCLGRTHEASNGWEEAAELYDRARDTIGQARCQMHRAATLPEADHAEAAKLLWSAVERLPAMGVSTALAWLHLARVDPRNTREQREKGLAALAQWDEGAEPLQVTEIRRRLESL
ncbi:tetratricopeptide (TPR) repeat protein [Streptosporangium album]|uniref:Tetratricopeptide (TPR) repeat protein n=1 Tax=Streptosporangium album TaxID=47479 RepID=A0A7W7S604_9ACTN|nr:hypothetical protein [Streptosporangium album]MBB4943898.1 tetratricopeptide (TPR) repeat protein [Streptosporangium album]